MKEHTFINHAKPNFRSFLSKTSLPSKWCEKLNFKFSSYVFFLVLIIILESIIKRRNLYSEMVWENVTVFKLGENVLLLLFYYLDHHKKEIPFIIWLRNSINFIIYKKENTNGGIYMVSDSNNFPSEESSDIRNYSISSMAETLISSQETIGSQTETKDVVDDLVFAKSIRMNNKISSDEVGFSFSETFFGKKAQFNKTIFALLTLNVISFLLTTFFIFLKNNILNLILKFTDVGIIFTSIMLSLIGRNIPNLAALDYVKIISFMGFVCYSTDYPILTLYLTLLGLCVHFLRTINLAKLQDMDTNQNINSRKIIGIYTCFINSCILLCIVLFSDQKKLFFKTITLGNILYEVLKFKLNISLKLNRHEDFYPFLTNFRKISIFIACFRRQSFSILKFLFIIVLAMSCLLGRRHRLK